jgi:hypothetical protein
VKPGDLFETDHHRRPQAAEGLWSLEALITTACADDGTRIGRMLSKSVRIG